jgi:ATP-dependent exoDNAse (exonuclease V) beta subunit
MYVLRETGTGISLLRLKKEYRKYSQELNLLYEQEYKKIFISELNSLYVALTRAKHELYGFIPKKVGGSYNLAQLLIDESQYTRGERVGYEETKKDETAIKALPASVYPDWIGYLKDEFRAISEVKNRSQRLKGEVMHFMLEHVGNLQGEQVETVLEKALAAAQHKYPDVGDVSVYCERLHQLIADPGMRPFFYCGNARVLTESEVVDTNGLTKRCDRLIIDGGTIKVVDYKQSPDTEGKDREQVKEYKGILKQIYPERAVSGFLIYLDSLEAVEV